MKKPFKIAEELKELGRLSRETMTPEIVKEIKRAIKSPTSQLAAKAVNIAAENGLQELIPDMLTAFDKFMEDGAKTDKGCRAKITILKALNTFEYLGAAIYLSAVHYTQMEASFGPPEDTAVELRGLCALALARIGYPDAHYILADLLVESEKGVRAAAARALAYIGNPEGELMLRMKLLTGDSETEVLAECFLALMTMAPKKSLAFVSRYLHHRNSHVVESAAIAIGGSHLPEALAALREIWDAHPYYAARRNLLVPIALVRSDEAFALLLNALRGADQKTAADSLSVLHLFAGENYTNQVRDVIAQRADPDITARFQQEFGEA